MIESLSLARARTSTPIQLSSSSLLSAFKSQISRVLAYQPEVASLHPRVKKMTDQTYIVAFLLLLLPKSPYGSKGYRRKEGKKPTIWGPMQLHGDFLPEPVVVVVGSRGPEWNFFDIFQSNFTLPKCIGDVSMTGFLGPGLKHLRPGMWRVRRCY